MKNFKKYILTIALSLAVIVSIVLSVILWSNPSYNQTKRGRPNSDRSSVVRKSLANVYMPTQVIYTNRNAHQNLITDPMVNIMSEIRTRVARGRYGRLRRVSAGSKSTYAKYLNRRRSLLLSYQGNVTFDLLKRVINQRLKVSGDPQFNRIVLPLAHGRNVYLLRDSGHVVYKSHVTGHRLTGLGRIIDRPLKRIPVKLLSNRSRPMLAYQKKFTMPQYEYLISRQSEDYYIMRLLSNTQHITRTRHKRYVTYSNNFGRRLRFGHYRNVSYINDRTRASQPNYNRALFNSYHDLMKMALPINDVHYFGYDPGQHDVVYRGFIEGFPIFNPMTQFGMINFKRRDRSLTCQYSLNYLQIPIPSERKSVELPSTREVLDQLKARGYQLKHVESITMGYRWQNAKSAKLLANLVPGWFIEYNHNWISYDQLRNSPSIS